MKKILIVVEETSTGYSAYSPDLPGCVSTGRTREEVEHKMREAIDFHLEGMRIECMDVPDPHSYSAYIEARTSDFEVRVSLSDRQCIAPKL